MKKLTLAAVVGLGLSATSGFASTLSWVDWTAASATSATGHLGDVEVSFSGLPNPGVDLGGGENFWAFNSQIYTPTGAEEAPQDSDMIRLTGGTEAGTQTITFSRAVVDPVMAIFSLGRGDGNGAGLSRYVFDTDFTILNQGSGKFGAGEDRLTQVSGNTLDGEEGYGLIQFSGSYTSISWDIPIAEFWGGIQVGFVNEQQVAPVPLPASALLLLGGIASFAAVGRRKRKAA